MPATDEISFEFLPPGQDGLPRLVVVTENPAYIGESGVLRVKAHVRVKDSSPVNASQEVFKQVIPLTGNRTEVKLPADGVAAYAYEGTKIAITLTAEFNVGGHSEAVTELSQAQAGSLASKPSVSVDPAQAVDPIDAFNLGRNLRALNPLDRFVARLLILVAILVCGGNAAIGVRDQLTPEGRTWLYSHRDSDGDAQSPAVAGLGLSGAGGFMFWLAIRRQLRKYMTLRLGVVPTRIDRNTRLRLDELVVGLPRVKLEGCTLRVVAANQECGQYIRGSGTDRRTVSFRDPVRAVMLTDLKLPSIPANSSLAPYLAGEVDFTPMFNALYPPFMVTGTHGVDVHWEVQLLHPDFVDQELVGPKGRFSFAEFLRSG